MQYVSKDKAEGVLFVFRVYQPNPVNLPVIYLRGLAPDANYSIEGQKQIRSGAGWMAAGLRVDLQNLHSRVIKIRRVD